jgi:hypothetical protein
MFLNVVAASAFKIQIPIRTGARKLHTLANAFGAHPAGHEGDSAPINVRPPLALTAFGRRANHDFFAFFFG